MVRLAAVIAAERELVSEHEVFPSAVAAPDARVAVGPEPVIDSRPAAWFVEESVAAAVEVARVEPERPVAEGPVAGPRAVAAVAGSAAEGSVVAEPVVAAVVEWAAVAAVESVAVVPAGRLAVVAARAGRAVAAARVVRSKVAAVWVVPLAVVAVGLEQVRRALVVDIVVAEAAVGEWSAVRWAERRTAELARRGAAASVSGPLEHPVVRRVRQAVSACPPDPALAARAACRTVVAAAAAAFEEHPVGPVARQTLPARPARVAHPAPAACRIAEPVAWRECPAVVARHPAVAERHRRPVGRLWMPGGRAPRLAGRIADSYKAAWVFEPGNHNLCIETCSFAVALSWLPFRLSDPKTKNGYRHPYCATTLAFV